MNFGLILNEPSDVYHATDAVSSHRLNDFAAPSVPLLYYRKHVAKTIPQEPPSESLEFGRYFHMLALEGEAAADSRFVVVPDSAPKRPTKKQKEAKKPSPETVEAIKYWTDFDIANAGKSEVSTSDHDLAWRMVDAIRAKPSLVEMLKHGRPEVTFRHQMASFAIQCRTDWFDERPDEFGRPLILDVKTIDSLANFDHHFLKFNYWRQAPFYRMVVYETLKLTGAFPRFSFLVVEKDEPYQCKLCTPDDTALELGHTAVMRDMERLKRCYDTNNWPGEPEGEQTVSLPEWFIKRFPQ